jgi:cell division protein FtsW (lipid II flippase)
LPFFSLGGSSFLASALSLGLLESMRRSSLLPHARVY